MIKRTTLIVTAILGLLLLAAGGATAAYFLHSTTTVEENDIDSEYIVISSSSYTDFLDEVSFDTTVSYDPSTQTSSTTYNLNKNADIWNTTGDTYGPDLDNDSCLISNVLTINVGQTNTTGLYTLEITVSDFNPISGLTYVMVITSTQGTQYSEYLDASHPNKWVFYDLTFGLDHSVALYVMGTPNEDPGATVGFTNYDPDARDNNNQPAPVTGSIFTFLATAPNGAP